jgi:hypothetical protein
MIGASGHAPTLESAIADFRSLREWRGGQVVHVFRWRSSRFSFPRGLHRPNLLRVIETSHRATGIVSSISSLGRLMPGCGTKQTWHDV